MISEENPPRPPFYLCVALLLCIGLGGVGAFALLMAVCRVLEGG